MGMVLGKISVETPNYETVKTTNEYEIRKYPPSVTAKVTYDPSELSGGRDGGFSLLAKYIGVTGKPLNAGPEKIAMTAPVLTNHAGDSKVTMKFLLPAKFGRAEEAPRPADERVEIGEEGERSYGVVRFSGVATEAAVAEKAARLREWLERDGFKVVGEVLLARYNPPWTLPPFRTNEVLLPIQIE